MGSEMCIRDRRSALSWLVAVGVLVRLGASLECCGEGASFWDDLDDPARTPSGAGPHAASQQSYTQCYTQCYTRLVV